LKKDNEECVIIERMGYLTIGDETKDVLYVKDLKDKPLCPNN